MKENFLTCRQMLNELNDFSCKVEFLQSRLRKSISEKEVLNLSDYLDSLKKIMLKHEKNLKEISIKNNQKIMDVIFPGLEPNKSINSNVKNKIIH